MTTVSEAVKLIQTKYLPIKLEIDKLVQELNVTPDLIIAFVSKLKLRTLNWTIRGTEQHFMAVHYLPLKLGTDSLPYAFLVIDSVLIAWHKLPTGCLMIDVNGINDRPLAEFEFLSRDEVKKELVYLNPSGYPINL